MPRGVKTETWKIQYILDNADKMTAVELAKELVLSEVKIYVVCKQHGIKPKPPGKTTSRPVNAANSQVKQNIHEKTRHYEASDKPKTPISRPPAVYSNRTPFGIATDLNKKLL